MFITLSGDDMCICTEITLKLVTAYTVNWLESITTPLSASGIRINKG